MRFSDGPTAEVTVEIDSTPASVWERVIDIAVPAEHSNELQRAEWQDPETGPAVGAVILGVNQRGERRWETTSTVTRCDAGECFEWSVDEPEPGAGAIATWGFDLEELASGDSPRTRVTQRVRLGPGPSGLTAAIEANPDNEAEIIAARLAFQRQAMQATLDAIKADLEDA